MDDLADLIARVEAGTAEDQDALMEEAYAAIFPPVPPTPSLESERHYYRFFFMLNANAFVDAALMMVPELSAWHISSACPRDACATIESGDDRVQDFKGRASTPALALTAAILRARRDA